MGDETCDNSVTTKLRDNYCKLSISNAQVLKAPCLIHKNCLSHFQPLSLGYLEMAYYGGIKSTLLAANGPGTEPICLIKNSPFSISILALWANKNWLPSMKLKELEKFLSKIGLRGCKWSSLNAPGTEIPMSPISHY